MPTCGWLMIGVSNSAPRLPVLVSVKVPPDRSSGLTLAGPGAVGQVGDLAGQPADVQVAGVLDDRDHQPALGVDGDAEVLGVVVGDLAGRGVDARVQLRVHLERLDGGQREERQEGELHALPCLERRLRAVRGAGRSQSRRPRRRWSAAPRSAATRPCAVAMTWRSRDIRSVVPRRLDGTMRRPPLARAGGAAAGAGGASRRARCGWGPARSRRLAAGRRLRCAAAGARPAARG